jgi:thiamine biosynthesis lipoprotein
MECGMQHLQLDEAPRTVRFARPGMSLDLGGFGKGYALNRLADGLKREGVQRAFLSFGESSITVLGRHPHGPAWPVGIANAAAPSETVYSFALCDASLSCSGTTPGNFFGEGQVFGETLNPHTGRPIEGYRTICVASTSAADAEVLSTALLNTEDDRRPMLLQEFGAQSAVEITYQPSDQKQTHHQQQPHNLQLNPHIRWRYENRI